MLCLLGALAWSAIEPGVWSGHFYRLPVLALTHVFTLGWISLLIQGVLLCLAPQLFSFPRKRRVLAYTIAVLWLVGAAGTIAHMARGEWFGVWTAATCLWIAALLLPVYYRDLMGKAIHGSWVARYAVAAMLHLVLAASLGLLIGLNRHLEWVGVDPFAWLGVHFHLAEVGWVTFMILGFGRKLLPISAPDRSRERRESWIRWIGIQSGLVLTITGLLTAEVVLKAGASLLAAALLLHVRRPVLQVVRGRIRDRSSFWASVAAAFLLLDAVLGLLLAWDLKGIPGSRDRLQYAYGVIAFLGWNTIAMTSFALKLFPWWVWRARFASDWGTCPVPAVQDLYRPWLREATGLALSLGTLLIAAGLIGAIPILCLWGARIALLGGLCFLANILLVTRWALFPVRFSPGPHDWERFRALRGHLGVSSPIHEEPRS